MNPDDVKIPSAEIISMIRKLDSIVMSLDRIGGYSDDIPIEEFKHILATYIIDWKVPNDLAKVRSILSKYAAATMGPSLEKKRTRIKHWSSRKKT